MSQQGLHEDDILMQLIKTDPSRAFQDLVIFPAKKDISLEGEGPTIYCRRKLSITRWRLFQTPNSVCCPIDGNSRGIVELKTSVLPTAVQVLILSVHNDRAAGGNLKWKNHKTWLPFWTGRMCSAYHAKRLPNKTHIYLSNLINRNAPRLLLVSKYKI